MAEGYLRVGMPSFLPPAPVPPKSLCTLQQDLH